MAAMSSNQTPIAGGNTKVAQRAVCIRPAIRGLYVEILLITAVPLLLGIMFVLISEQIAEKTRHLSEFKQGAARVFALLACVTAALMLIRFLLTV